MLSNCVAFKKVRCVFCGKEAIYSMYLTCEATGWTPCGLISTFQKQHEFCIEKAISSKDWADIDSPRIFSKDYGLEYEITDRQGTIIIPDDPRISDDGIESRDTIVSAPYEVDRKRETSNILPSFYFEGFYFK